MTMTFEQARSHAMKRVNELRAAEFVEEMLATAMLAENARKEAEAARDKAQAKEERLEKAVQKLVLAHDTLALSIKGKAEIASTEALEVETQRKSAHAALVKTRKADLAAKLLEGANQIDHLHEQIVTRTEELAVLDNRVEGANAALAALKAGLPG